MDLGGWRTRSVFSRYNVTSERDLGDALERVSAYVAARAEESPTVQRLTRSRTEVGQSPGRDAAGSGISAESTDWRRAESNRGPRDYETLALAN